jgi:hypothetical protein
VHSAQPAVGTVSSEGGPAAAAQGDPEDPRHKPSDDSLTSLHKSLEDAKPGRAVPWGPSPGAKAMMRAWRTLCALLVTGLCIAIWAAMTSSNEPKRYSYSYDAAAGLELNTFGCDIRMLPSDTPSLYVDFISGCGHRSQQPPGSRAEGILPPASLPLPLPRGTSPSTPRASPPCNCRCACGVVHAGVCMRGCECGGVSAGV